MKLKPEDARNVVYRDHGDWARIEGTECITGQGRWDTSYEAVFLHKPSGKHYMFDWSQGSTEGQDQEPYEYNSDDVCPCLVIQKEVTETKWVAVKGS